MSLCAGYGLTPLWRKATLLCISGSCAKFWARKTAIAGLRRFTPEASGLLGKWSGRYGRGGSDAGVSPLKDASEEGNGETAVRSGTGEGVVNEPPILLVPAEETSRRRGLRIWVASGVGLGLVAALLAVGLRIREKNAGVDKENKAVGSATVGERVGLFWEM